MNAPTPRQSNLGCLGCFSIICLTTALLVESAALWWLNPGWFDRVAFWRGPRYEQHVVLVQNQNPSDRARLEGDAPSVVPQKVMPTIRKPVRIRFGRVATVYEPAVGARLPISDRGVLSIPPGAIGESTEVSLTPLLVAGDDMAAPFAGPLVDIRIGDRDSFRFRRPVTLTMPYEGFGENDEPSIAGWKDGRWNRLPTTIDRERRTVTAELDHASLWAVLTGTATFSSAVVTAALWTPVVGAVVSSSTVRGNFEALEWFNCPKLNTSDGFFRIHYTTTGEDKIPDDATFRNAGIPFDGVAEYAEHPLYVQYIGSLLERCRKDFGTMLNLHVPSPKVTRYNVFLLDLDDSYGESGLGGPLFIASDLFAVAKKKPVPKDDMIRYTVAHELTHVAQDAYFSVATGMYSYWFVELMAAYVSFKYWHDWGYPINSLSADIYLKGRERLLLQPMDKIGDLKDTGGEMTYRYFIFPRWFDQKFGSPRGMEFLLRACDSSFGKLLDLEDLDEACQREFSGVGLAGLFEAFASDFYQSDLWSRRTFPEIHLPDSKRVQASKQSRASESFLQVTKPVTSDGMTAVVNLWARHYFGIEKPGAGGQIPYLSAEAVYMDAGPFPKSQKAKLVVRYEAPHDLSPNLRVLLAESECGDRIPCRGKPGQFSELALQPGKGTNHVVDLIGQKNRPDRVTVLAVNRSFEESVAAGEIQRWLLMPPENVRFARADPGSRLWRVDWDPVEIRFRRSVFYGYEVLRRRVGEPDSAYVALKPTSDEYTYDNAPTDDDYIYTVRVVDRFENRSHPAPVPDRDPFVGDWFGIIREQNGLYINQSMDQLRGIYDDRVALARAKIRRMPETTEHQRQIKREEIESQKFVEDLGSTMIEGGKEIAPLLGEIVRLGLPATFSIHRRSGEYFLTVKTLLGITVEDPAFHNVPLERAGHRALKMKNPPTDFLSEAIFHSPRENYIKPKWSLVRSHTDPETGIEYEFRFRWWFKRSGFS